MSTTADRLAELSARRDLREGGITVLLASEGGYAAYLATAAEHPTMRPSNLAAIARFRKDNDLSGWLELLSATRGEAPGYNSVEGLGGGIPDGTPSVGVVFPNIVKGDNEQFETKGTKVVQLFPASMCTHLKEHFKGRPIHVERNFDKFQRAAANIDLEHLSPAADFILGKRYGIDSDRPVPALPDVSDLMVECNRLADELKHTIAKIDANLRTIEQEDRAAARQPLPSAHQDALQDESLVPEKDPMSRVPAKTSRNPRVIPSTADMLAALSTAEKTTAAADEGRKQGKESPATQST